MKITTNKIIAGLVLLLVLAATVIWLAGHIFNLANVVSGGN